MPKRKHNEISSSETTSNAPTAKTLRLQRLQLDGLLDQSKNSLFRSLKLARGFERQKLGRRQKTAKAERDAVADTARLEAEVAALKGLDLASTAEIHLYRSLLKIKPIASAPAFPHHVQATIDASKKPQEPASANVQARLFKSGPVQAAMTDALKGVRVVLGIEELKANGKKRMRAKDYESGLSAKSTIASSLPRKDEGPIITGPVGDEWGGISTPQSMQENESEEHSEDDEVDYDMYASRLAGSSDEEPVGEDAEGHDHDRDKSNDMSITEDEAEIDESHEYEEEEEEEDSHDDDIEDSHQTSNKPIPKPKPNPPTAPPNSTTFLPSLSLGGYWSGSDSSLASSDHDSSAAKIEGRKNRMGQQARRALWEKKFGKNANHVKKQGQAQIQDRDQGWDVRKGAQGVDERGKRGRGRGGFGRGVDVGRGGSRGGGRFAKSTGANSDPVVARKAQPKPAAEGALHPSWEAARKAKEQKKAMPFQGKKVVFD